MQEFSMYSQIQPQFPEQEQLKCPRCDSTNTKFCYYNNYNLSQPRHFCKNCKRYWTKGGTLRNIPVGGGSRKRSSPSSTATATSTASKRPAAESAPPKDKKTNVAKNTGENLPQKGENFGGQFDNLSFSTFLGSNRDQYVGSLDGLGPNGSNLRVNEHFGDVGSGRNVNLGLEVGDGDGFLNMGGDAGDDGCWEAAGGNQWPDLAIYTPGSNFQ